MICKHCGERNLRSDRYCAKCGAKLDNASNTAVLLAIICMCVLTAAAAIAAAIYAPQCGGMDVEVSYSDAVPNSEAQQKTVSSDMYTTQTTASSTSQTTVTEKTTTSTTVRDVKNELRSLLVSKKWSARIMGIDTLVSFKADGSAKVELDLFFTKTVVDGGYDIGSGGEFTLTFSYGGKEYAAQGDVTSFSESRIVVHVGDDEFILAEAD